MTSTPYSATMPTAVGIPKFANSDLSATDVPTHEPVNARLFTRTSRPARGRDPGQRAFGAAGASPGPQPPADGDEEGQGKALRPGQGDEDGRGATTGPNRPVGQADQQRAQEPRGQEHEQRDVGAVEEAPHHRARPARPGRRRAIPRAVRPAGRPRRGPSSPWRDRAPRRRGSRTRSALRRGCPTRWAAARIPVCSRLVAPVEAASPALYWKGWPSAIARAYWPTR